MDKDDFRREILTLEPLQFCRRWLFGPETWLFSHPEASGAVGDYTDFKVAISGVVNTSPNNISIVGSGKFGFSPKPGITPLLRDFHNKSSDIDIVIISDSLFESIWASCREAYFSGYTHVMNDHSKEIFKKFIILRDDRKYPSQHLRDAVIMMDEMKKVISSDFRIRRTINYRLYASSDSAEAYHVSGIERLRMELNDGA